eukprot:1651470-Pyramimonas_sp.AAC.1
MEDELQDFAAQVRRGSRPRGRFGRPARGLRARAAAGRQSGPPWSRGRPGVARRPGGTARPRLGGRAA